VAIPAEPKIVAGEMFPIGTHSNPSPDIPVVSCCKLENSITVPEGGGLFKESSKVAVITAELEAAQDSQGKIYDSEVSNSSAELGYQSGMLLIIFIPTLLALTELEGMVILALNSTSSTVSNASRLSR
jgi:hypothetical protein